MIKYTFNNGPRITIKDETHDTFLVKVYSNENGVKKFTTKFLMNNNQYYTLLREWYTNWYFEIYIYEDDEIKLYTTYQFDLKDTNVLIRLFTNDSKDKNIWYNECKRFKSIHKCKINVVDSNVGVGGIEYYATYNIGRFDMKENSIDKYGDFEQHNGRINDVYITYDSFKNQTDWKYLTSKQIADDILGLYDIEENKEPTFSEKLDNFYSDLKIKTKVNIMEIKDNFKISFIDGPRLEILGASSNVYTVYFIDTDSNIVVHSDRITSNHWVKANRVWYTNWKISVSFGNETIFEHYFSCKGERVYIALDSKSLGDTIAWMPYLEEFAKKNECKVICSTFWNKMFQSDYPDLEFVEPGSTVDNLYAMFVLGIFGDGHSGKNKQDTRQQPLQSVATDILGLEYKEIKPKIKKDYVRNDKRDKPYVCIAEHGSAQSKYWNNPNGWQEVVDYLVSIGYDVDVISKEPTTLKNVINSTGDKPIENRILTLKYASAFIGISSGLSWLAWAIGTPVIMISGHTDVWYEFECYRISPPKNICHGCWHDYDFDKGNWNWCPVNEHTNRHFECTKQIGSNMIIDGLKTILAVNTVEASNKEIVPKKLKFSEFYIADTKEPVNLMLEGRQEEKDLWDEIFRKKIYQYNDCKINKDDIVFDIGANIGMFTRYASAAGAHKIYAFEPEEKNAELFIKNKPDNCIFFNEGISDMEGRQELNIDGTIGGHSIMRTNSFGTKTGKTQFPMFRTLESIIEQEKIAGIDFLKIDVEGAEFKVMRGLTNNTLYNIKKCVVEYHHNVFNHDDRLKTQFISRFISTGFTFHEEPINKHFQILYFWR